MTIVDAHAVVVIALTLLAATYSPTQSKVGGLLLLLF